MPADGELMPAEEEKLYRFLLETWAVFDEKFHPGSDWLRPLYLLSPEEAAAYQERIGARRDARWMIIRAGRRRIRRTPMTGPRAAASRQCSRSPTSTTS